MIKTKSNENTKVGKLTYNEKAGSYITVIPKEFVEKGKLEGYIKISILENGKISLEKLEL